MKTESLIAVLPLLVLAQAPVLAEGVQACLHETCCR